MSFTASGGVPELFTYSLVGNEGLDIISGLNKVNLSGNLYAGCEMRQVQELLLRVLPFQTMLHLM